jgi:hypothetical protein
VAREVGLDPVVEAHFQCLNGHGSELDTDGPKKQRFLREEASDP